MDIVPLEVFAVVLALFHLSEFILAYVYMRAEFSLTSSLFSVPYCFAMACAVFEYCTEAHFLPAIKTKVGFTCSAQECSQTRQKLFSMLNTCRLAWLSASSKCC